MSPFSHLCHSAARAIEFTSLAARAAGKNFEICAFGASYSCGFSTAAGAAELTARRKLMRHKNYVQSEFAARYKSKEGSNEKFRDIK